MFQQKSRKRNYLQKLNRKNSCNINNNINRIRKIINRFILSFPFSFVFSSILLFATVKYDVAMHIRPMRSFLSWQKVIKCHGIFLRSENSGGQVNYSRILLYITDWNWVDLERRDCQYGNRETHANMSMHISRDL